MFFYCLLSHKSLHLSSLKIKLNYLIEFHLVFDVKKLSFVHYNLIGQMMYRYQNYPKCIIWKFSITHNALLWNHHTISSIINLKKLENKNYRKKILFAANIRGDTVSFRLTLCSYRPSWTLLSHRYEPGHINGRSSICPSLAWWMWKL